MKVMKPGDQAAEDGIAAAGELAIVGEAFGERHRDACADRRGRPDQEDGVGVVRREGCGEDRRQRGDRAVHEAGEAGLDDAQHKVLVVADKCGEFLADWVWNSDICAIDAKQAPLDRVMAWLVTRTGAAG